MLLKMLMILFCQYFHQRLFLENNVGTDLAKLIIMFKCWPRWTKPDPPEEFLWRYLLHLASSHLRWDHTTPSDTFSHHTISVLILSVFFLFSLNNKLELNLPNCGVNSGLVVGPLLSVILSTNWNEVNNEVNKRIMLLKYFTRLMMMLRVPELWRQKPKPGTGRVKQLTRKS